MSRIQLSLNIVQWRHTYAETFCLKQLLLLEAVLCCRRIKYILLLSFRFVKGGESIDKLNDRKI
jgi:hypothetical protein